MIFLWISFIFCWLCLFSTRFIKKDQTDECYVFTISESFMTGNIGSLLIYALWAIGLRGPTLFYISSIVVLFIIQAVIDWKYQEIALEWVVVSIICNVMLMMDLGLFSHHLIGFTLSIFILLVLYAMYVGFGLGDVLILSSNLLLISPLQMPSDQTLFWYAEGYRNFIFVFMVSQLLAWGYMYIKGNTKKGSKTAFMPWYTTTFIGWFYLGLI